MSYPSYLVHFNPNHDKLGRFTYSKDITNKYTAASVRGKNRYDNPELASEMEKNLHLAYLEKKTKPNTEKFKAKEKELSNKAYKMADEYAKKNNIEYEMDDRTDQAYIFFDYLREKAGFDIREYNISALEDLGYNRKDAKTISDFIGQSINWDRVWSDKVNAFVEPGGTWNEELHGYTYVGKNGIPYAVLYKET